MTATDQTLLGRYRAKLLESEPRERGFHVTSLIYDCARRCFYNVTEEAKFDPVVQLKMNLGQVIHKYYRLDGVTHELRLQWEGLVGSLDVYVQETGELLDLKSIWTPGQYIKELPYAHHAKQIEYYALLLSKNSLRIGPATVLYVPINVAKEISLRPMTEIEAEVTAKVKAIQQAQKTGKPPDGTYNSRECRFCPFLTLCEKAGGWPNKQTKGEAA